MGDITKNFSKQEFACKCGCGYDNISEELVLKLQGIRDVLGQQIKINCGCRCSKHNKEVGGEPNSAHLRGLAADVTIPGSVFRYVFVRLAQQRFKRIGIYPSFCHVDVDDKLPQHVMWYG